MADDHNVFTRKLITCTDSVTVAPVEAFAVRSERDRRYFGCFVLGLPHVNWSAVMDDFGNLVTVERHA